MLGDFQILQLLPAGDWLAAYDSTGGSYRPLVSWALIRRPDGSNDVIGLTAAGREVAPASSAEFFRGYVHRSEI